ncbi:GPW/gp25 family protein [uncultured Cohaesibacter sp.]|uniref:GPW/gp25 family protein n=1 Tax=uncultured Cohaesibacter sp. TaxID=1002546 RepID=UPI0029C614D2|nr:GPW/gp25 family protein [uncultured Cohaesibacter sp.]
MVGICKQTGELITPLQSAMQGVVDILNTRLRSVLTLRQYGSGAPELLGRKLNLDLLVAFRQLVSVSIDMWEPRLSVRRIAFTGTAAEFQQGHVTMRIEADFMPRAHLDPPDYTIEKQVSFAVLNSDGSLILT